MKPLTFILSSIAACAAISVLAAYAPASVPNRLVQGGREAAGAATRSGPIVLTEIHAQPAARSDGRDVRFVELYNSNPFSQDMGGWKLSGDLVYTFPAGYKMPGCSYVVIAPSPRDVESVYGLTGVLGATDGGAFSYTAELSLNDELGAELFSIKIKDADPWPGGIAGTGHSLVLTRPSRGQTRPAAWSRSAQSGGSPGRADPSAATTYATILINELIPHDPATSTGAIELINIGSSAVSLAGCRLVSQQRNAAYTFPAGTTLAAHAILAVDETTLRFAISGNKDEILLRAPSAGGDAIIDAVRLPAVALAGAYGRTPDGATAFTHLAAPTPGGRNASRALPPVVLNEIMYHPLDENKEHEYVELFNTTDTDIDLTGWVLSGDIDYECTETIPAKGHLVIANKRSAFSALYPNFTGHLGTDGFTGSLPNGSGTLRLRRPMAVWDASVFNVVNSLVLQEEVIYCDGGAWPELADGGGSSLERVDPRSDPHLAGSWAASDETKTCGWKTLEFTGAIEYGRADDSYGDPTQVELGLFDAGECLIDSVVLKSATGSNLVNNPSFESSNTTWKFLGTHQDSAIENATDADNGTKVLHLRTTGRLHTGGNGIRGTLWSQLPKSGIGTISMRVRWLAGSPDALMRARGNWIEACGDITTTHAFGTPGRTNSRAVANAAPAIAEVTHEPLLPANGQPVTVYARVADPDGVASVNLIWYLDGVSSSTTIPMSPCEAGWYAASIPAAANDSLVAFQVTATDSATTARTSTYPADTRRECLVRWNEPHTSNTFGVYRFWVTAANLAIWQNRSQDSNYSIPCTFVYGNDRVVYGAGIQYGGSPFHCKGFSRPINNGFIDYKLDFPRDDQILDDDGLVLACAGNPGSGEDPTVFKEQFCYALAKRLGQPAVYRRVVHLYANGQVQNAQGVVEDTEKPNSSMISHWFPTKTDGRLYKCDDWFEYNPNNFGDFKYQRGGKEIGATLESFTTTEGNGDPAFGTFYKKARYRWHWLPRAAANFQANDYQDFYTLIHAFNDFSNPAYVRNLATVADTDAFLAISALHVYVGNYDSYGNERGKNAYIYNGNRGWALLAWDIDTSFGAPNTRDTSMSNIVDPQSSSLKVIDPTLKTMLATPAHARGYWRKFIALVEACTADSEDLVNYRERYDALRADGVTMSGFTTVANNIQTRRANVLNQINAANAAGFTLTSPTVSDKNQFTLTGEAPFEVATITCNGKPLDVTWTSVRTWSAPYTLTDRTKTITLNALREDGTIFTTAVTTLTYTGPSLDSINDHLVIATILTHPVQPGGSYFEVYNSSTNTSFDLAGVYTTGSAAFTFPDGFILAPRTSAVVVENSAVFSALYGNRALVAGTFTGSLPDIGSLDLRRPAKGLELVESTLDHVEWGGEGWPSTAEGEALTLISPTLDNAQPVCWRAAGTRDVHLGTRTLLPLDQFWHYLTTKPADNWKSASFNDAAWPAGAGPLGHDPDASNWSIHFGTDVPLDSQRATYYFRTQFNYTPPDESSSVHTDNVFPDLPAATLAARCPDGNYLVHRWSFNGDLLDTVGGQNATRHGSAMPTFNTANTAITCAGGSKGRSWIDLGSNILPRDNTPVTLEIWATQNSVQNWGRVFDIGNSESDYILIAWTSGTTLNKEAMCIKKVGGDISGYLAPFTLGTEFHISVVFLPKADGSWAVTFRKKDATTGSTLGEYTMNISSGWSLAVQGQNNCWLAHSQYNDNDAAATYNEVRVWNAALSDAQLTDNAKLGPDKLPTIINDVGTGTGIRDTINVRYMVDDCAALYLNGVELHRSARTPAGALDDASLATTHTPQELEGTFTESFELNPSLLRAGSNTLAVEVHQNVVTSSDIAWAIEIEATSILSSTLPPGRYQPAATIPDGLPAFVPTVPTPPEHGFNDIRLNEFMAQNALFTNPLTSAFDDWFELYNNGTNTVSLGGWLVTDTLKTTEPPTPNTKATKSLVLPANVVLAPGETLRIWTGADDSATLPFDPANLQAPFGLSKSADAIYLFDPATNLVDAITYDTPQSDTTSLGRWPNGTGEWVAFAVPTPGAANHPTRFEMPLLAGANAFTLRVGTPFTSALAPENAFAATTTFALVPETGSSIPNGLSVNSSTGTLNWTPSGPLAPGVYFLNLCPVADGEAIDALPIAFTVLPPVSDVLIAVGLEANTLATTQTLRLTWQGQPNATYTVEWCDDLTTANWQPFPEAANLQGPIGPQSILLDLTKLGPRKPQAFFRVKETK